jgi:integrase
MPQSIGGITVNVDTFMNQILHQLPIREKTRANYRSAFFKNIAPIIGNRELSEVNKSAIFEILAYLPPQTKYQCFMVLRTIFREAHMRELIEINPILSIPTPKVQVEPGRFLTWEEIEKIDFGKQSKRIQFLALHGLRWGEAAALTQDDIKDGVIHVSRSIHGKTKTTAGVRKVPLLSEFVPFAVSQRAVANALKPYGVTVHSLRKTYAYVLKTSGVHVTTAARLMGHSNPMVTLKIYTQVLDEELEESRNLIINKVKG